MYYVVVIRSAHAELCHEMLRLIARVEGVPKAALVEQMHQSAFRFVENASGMVVHPSAGGELRIAESIRFRHHRPAIPEAIH